MALLARGSAAAAHSRRISATPTSTGSGAARTTATAATGAAATATIVVVATSTTPARAVATTSSCVRSSAAVAPRTATRGALVLGAAGLCELLGNDGLAERAAPYLG